MLVKTLTILLLINASVGEIKDFPMPNYSTALSRVIIDFVFNFFLDASKTVNMYEVSSGNVSSVNMDIMNEVLYTVRRKAVVQVDSLTNGKLSVVKHYVNIIFVESLAAFEKFYAKMTFDNFEYQGYFLIAVTSHADDIYTTMMRIFEVLWSNHIINANVIFMPSGTKGEALMYTYYPYSPFYCERAIPLQLNHYRDKKWINPIDYYPQKLQNFYGCPLRVATFSNPPFMMIAQDKRTGAVTVDGLDGIMMRVLSQQFNFNVQLFLSPELWGDIYDNGTVTGAIRMIVEEEVNMTLGFFATNPARDAMMKSGYVYYTTNLVWIVPPGKPQSALQKLLNPLGSILWISSSVTILVGFLVIALVCHQKSRALREFVFGTRMQSPGMNLVNMVFGGSLHHLPRRNFARFLMALFLFFTFILRSCYTGGLVKFMQMDTREQRLKTTNELLEHNFTLYMLHSARAYLTEMPHVLSRVKLITVNEYTEGVKELIVDPYAKGAYLTSIGHLAYRNFMVFPHHFHHYTPEPLYTLNIAIYMHKQSCLAAPFNEVIRNLVNGGLVAKWASTLINYQYLKQLVDENPVALSVTQLKGCFELLLAGLLMSSQVFIFEILIENRVNAVRLMRRAMKSLKRLF